MKALDEGICDCDIYGDLQKAFDTVNHISTFVKNISTIARGVLQWSGLGPLLFVLYVNDLHLAIKYC